MTLPRVFGHCAWPAFVFFAVSAPLMAQASYDVSKNVAPEPIAATPAMNVTPEDRSFQSAVSVRSAADAIKCYSGEPDNDVPYAAACK